MARIKIDLPGNFPYITNIEVRITDINNGGHVGNDSILSILQEARVRFFNHYGYTELNLEGVGMIMSDVGIEFKAELFYGEKITASVAAGNFSKVSFDIFYKLEKIAADARPDDPVGQGKTIPVAYAKSGVVTYDYQQKKIVPVPGAVRAKMNG